jgi:hypothetical protein
MHSARPCTSRYGRIGLVGILAACGACSRTSSPGQSDAETSRIESTPTLAIPPLSPDDVSWLFPAPTHAEDFAKLIAVGDLTTQNPKDPSKRDPVWPDAAFKQFLEIAASAAGQVETQSRIGLPSEAQSIDTWFIAGIRIDAGAPGLSSDIRAQFGRLPQIRLIIQPVTRNTDGTPVVHDIAGHLIYDFTLAKQNDPAQLNCFQRPMPDLDAFNDIVADLAAIRTKLSNGQLGTNKITTSGVPLGIHPGLSDPTTATNLRLEIKSFLERHISGLRLDAMAIAGLPSGAPEPWIFLSMLGVPPGIVPSLPNGGFVPVHSPALDGSQFAQMLKPAGTVPRVVPAPHTNNLNPITCRNAAVSTASLPIATRSGFATADVFITSPPPADKIKKILDVIADPTKSHFFNTDCVSCHTETRRTMELLNIKDIAGIDAVVLPNGPWDVRNFGWAPSAKGPFQSTVTRRTADETAAVVAFINSEVLAKQPSLNH